MRIWADGAFDLFHFGHSNILRQAKMKGDELIVGVNDFQDIIKHKGLPVMNDEERCFMVESCKWVDKVYKNIPYVTTYDLIKEKNIDLVVHGNDIATSSDGADVYDEIRQRGMYTEVERTKYISTTDLVGKMLLRRNFPQKMEITQISNKENEYYYEKEKYFKDLLEKFKIPEKKKIGKVVYIDGTFDLFHAGHASLLKKCRDKGYFVIVGVFSTESSISLKKVSPILSMNERILCLSACKYIDKIIENAPLKPDHSFLKKNDIEAIVVGSNDKHLNNYESVAKDYPIIEQKSDFEYLTTLSIIERIIKNYQEYEERNEKRKG